MTVCRRDCVGRHATGRGGRDGASATRTTDHGDARDTHSQEMTPFKDKAPGELMTNFSFSGESAISGMGK